VHPAHPAPACGCACAPALGCAWLLLCACAWLRLAAPAPALGCAWLRLRLCDCAPCAWLRLCLCTLCLWLCLCACAWLCVCPCLTLSVFVRDPHCRPRCPVTCARCVRVGERCTVMRARFVVLFVVCIHSTIDIVTAECIAKDSCDVDCGICENLTRYYCTNLFRSSCAWASSCGPAPECSWFNTSACTSATVATSELCALAQSSSACADICEWNFCEWKDVCEWKDDCVRGLLKEYQ